MKTPIRVLIVDNCATEREALAQAISSDPTVYLVGYCSELRDAVAALSTDSIDVVLLSYACGSDIERPLIAWAAKRSQPSRFVIIAKTFIPTEHLVWLVQHDISAICLNTGAASELAQAVRAAANGDKWIEHPFLVALLAAGADPSLRASRSRFSRDERRAFSSLASARPASARLDFLARRHAPRRPTRRYPECRYRDRLLISYLHAQAERRLVTGENASDLSLAAARAKLDSAERELFEHCRGHACLLPIKVN